MYFRLLNPDSCPVNKSHSDSCPCHRDNYESSGGSYFSKVRVVLPKMIIDGKFVTDCKANNNMCF